MHDHGIVIGMIMMLSIDNMIMNISCERESESGLEHD